MLAIGFKGGDYAFVYHEGRAIGAIMLGDAKPGSRESRAQILFSGRLHEFEVLRPSIVARRFGQRELERLVERFAL